MPAQVDVEKCEGCGQCVDVCSVYAIVMDEEKPQINKEDCVECVACVDECPRQAIAMKD